MSCSSAARRARIRARIIALEAAVTNAYTTLTAAFLKEEESYNFNSNEGQQQLKNIDTEKLQKTIDNMETMIDHLYDKYNCRGIVRLNLRRKQGGRRWR